MTEHRSHRHLTPARADLAVAVGVGRPLVRCGLALVLGAQPDMTVVGAAPPAEVVSDLVLADRAAVLIVDLDAGRPVDGLAELRRARPALVVIGLYLGRRGDNHGSADAGIDVALPMSAGTDGLLRAVRGDAVPMGRPAIERRTLPVLEALTRREREVLQQICSGLTSQQSAQVLALSPKTIDNHKQRIFLKLGVQNQAHAVAVAHRAGIFRPLPVTSDG